MCVCESEEVCGVGSTQAQRYDIVYSSTTYDLLFQFIYLERERQRNKKFYYTKTFAIASDKLQREYLHT